MKPVNDRIFSTSVDLKYTFKQFILRHKMTSEQIPVPTEEEGGVCDESIAEKVRKATMEVFAMDESASVQVSEECFIGTWTKMM